MNKTIRTVVFANGEGVPPIGVAKRVHAAVAHTPYEARRVEGNNDIVVYYRLATRAELRDLKKREREFAAFLLRNDLPVPTIDFAGEGQELREEMEELFQIDPWYPASNLVLREIVREARKRLGEDLLT